MWRVIASLLFCLSTAAGKGQTVLNGKVTGNKGQGIGGVSVTQKASYNGTTTADDGSFQFETSDTGLVVLVFTMVGYKPLDREVHVNGAVPQINITLKEAITDLNAVVVTAGSFEAGDKKRTTVLKSVDLVTTAGQQADVVAALRTLPGAQQIGEQEGLFVRGGTGTETKVFIDGMMVPNPFFSSVPGIAQRSRFSPLLFKGTLFSSGGYSAQYGQGLSSALILESIDLPSRSEVNLIVSSPQVSILSQKLTRAKDASYGVNFNYMNLAPYYQVVPQKYQFTTPPEALNTEFNYRKKTKTGILKFYGYAGKNKIGFERPELDHAFASQSIGIHNHTVFSTLTYTSRLPRNWQLYTGGSFSYNKDDVRLITSGIDTLYSIFTPLLTSQIMQWRSVLTKNFPGLTKLYLGAEAQDIKESIIATDSIPRRAIHDSYLAIFAEADIYYSSKLVSKAGIRLERTSLLAETSLSPRLSLAYKLSESSQFSFAYGMFYQKPEVNFLFRNPQLQQTRATHYILNYQKTQNGISLRIESYYKRYEQLITLHHNNTGTDLRNEGTGYAKGLEFFWRDKTTVKGLDYWISYSYLNTRRRFLDYPLAVQPPFAATHTANIVGKRWVQLLSTQFSTTYSFASGRPYYNPNPPMAKFMSDRTMHYHSLGLQANYLRTFGTVNAVFIINVSNTLGNQQVFSYRYATIPDAGGTYPREAVTPLARRFIFIGAYFSIGADRRKSILD